MHRMSSIAPAPHRLIRFVLRLTGVQRGKVTAIDDLANRLSHGINVTTARWRSR